MAITYTKLRSGEWGLRASDGSTLTPGASVTVRKQDGSTRTETVGKVLWSGDGVTLATKSDGHARGRKPRGSGSSPRGRRTGCACGSIEGEYHDWYCESCRFDELDM